MNSSVTADQVGRVRALIEATVEAGSFSGVCLVKQGENALLHEAHGFAHRGYAIPNTIDTRFDVASVTKLFTAVAMLQMVERGLVGLDTPIVPLLGIADTTIGNDVTIRHCLTHTSGISDDADEEAGEDYELLFAEKPNYSIRETTDFLPQFIHKPPVFPPGERARYNNVGFILLGLVVEKFTGLSYRGAVRQHVFERAGMTDSGFLAMDEVNSKLAEHYKRVEDEHGEVTWRKNIYSYPPIGSPDGGATVTALDLDRFYRSLLVGELLGDDLTRQMLTPQVKSSDTGSGSDWYGFAFQFSIDHAGEVVSFGKDGMNAGVASNAIYLPALDATVIVLANQDCNVWKLTREIVNELHRAES